VLRNDARAGAAALLPRAHSRLETPGMDEPCTHDQHWPTEHQRNPLPGISSNEHNDSSDQAANSGDPPGKGEPPPDDREQAVRSLGQARGDRRTLSRSRLPRWSAPVFRDDARADALASRHAMAYGRS
jgi:hypothetical protein